MNRMTLPDEAFTHARNGVKHGDDEGVEAPRKKRIPTRTQRAMDADVAQLSALIATAYADRSKMHTEEVWDAVERAIGGLDSGEYRVAEFDGSQWVVNEWLKQAIVLYFLIHESKPSNAGPLGFYDKVPMKTDWTNSGVRIVPPGVARYGSYLAPGVILMPGFVNIGARVGEGTMIDTWATVGSCAQIGAGVHLSGGVGIGGVLEPPSARPVIIEDGAFIGSRSIVVEGVVVGAEAVLGAGVVLTASTPIVDPGQSPAAITKGLIPPRAVVIPGTQPREFPGGTFGMPCALIIGRRTESTDRKTSLNAALRDYNVPV